jgi:hypothetical protein
MVALAFDLPIWQAPAKGHFVDVAVGSTFYPYIEALYAQGLISGYEDGTFRPSDIVTRGQVAKVVVRASGLPLENPAQPSFSDVAQGSVFYRYIETARANDIVSGYPDGTFRPSASATRGQIAKIVNVGSTPQHETNGHRPADQPSTYLGSDR